MLTSSFSLRTLLIGLAVGLCFAVLDGILNANPLAQRLYTAYKPISRVSVNAPLGMAFDLVFGVVMAVLYVLLSPALPGGPLLKGLAFGGIVWFFRVAMGSAGQMVMFNIPGPALVYMTAAGALEMLILGALYGVALKQ